MCKFSLPWLRIFSYFILADTVSHYKVVGKIIAKLTLYSKNSNNCKNKFLIAQISENIIIFTFNHILASYTPFFRIQLELIHMPTYSSNKKMRHSRLEIIKKKRKERNQLKLNHFQQRISEGIIQRLMKKAVIFC